MIEYPAEVAHPQLNADSITFEQPLNERMRTFLRLEFLYRQATFHAGDSTDFGARAAVGSLLEILTIVGRGDVRADVLKELDRHAELLSQYRRT
ncbi:MAG TPA: cell division protein ZapD, partial [Gammaproteobacteria bacterium]